MKMVNLFEFQFKYICVNTNIMNGGRHVKA